jgi:selenide,water dikinase
MPITERKSRDLVLIGGGHSHVEVLRNLARDPVAGLRTTVISRDLLVPYSGMLPGYIAGHCAWSDIHIDLAPLAAAAGARLIAGSVSGLNPAERTIVCEDRPAIVYDIASINCGATPALSEIRNADRTGIPVKPISQFIPHWQDLLERLRDSGNSRFRLAIVGGGAGGVELALAIRYRLARIEQLDHVDISLVCADPRLVLGHNELVRANLAKRLKDCGIDVHLSTRVVGAQAGFLETDTDGDLAADEFLWVTRAAPQRWAETAGITVDASGFILVNESLQSVSDPAIFAAGDNASVEGFPRPKAGVFAVRQGPVLAENLRRAVCGRALLRHQPQQNFLSLISTGERRALASWGDAAFYGRSMWYWKNWIDRRFMRRYRVRNVRPRLPRWHVSLSPDQSQSGASGHELLATLLERRGISRDAKACRPVVNTLEVHAVSGVFALVDDPYVAGQISAEHGLNDIYAMGAAPRSSMGWFSVPDAAQQQMSRDIDQLVAGAMKTFESAGVTWGGGRYVSGQQLRAGYSLIGTAHEDDIWLVSRCAVEDVLVVTKAIGTAGLLRAHARGQCHGQWLNAAIESMRSSNRAAVPLLRQAGAGAAGHITEEGLVGLSMRMANESGLCVELLPSRVPFLNGAEQCWHEDDPALAKCATAQIDFGEFADVKTSIMSGMQAAEHSGALLAAVKPDRAVACIAALRSAGYLQAAIVGRVVGARDDGRVVSLISE